jgi:hypothetical protein
MKPRRGHRGQAMLLQGEHHRTTVVASLLAIASEAFLQNPGSGQTIRVTKEHYYWALGRCFEAEKVIGCPHFCPPFTRDARAIEIGVPVWPLMDFSVMPMRDLAELMELP